MKFFIVFFLLFSNIDIYSKGNNQQYHYHSKVVRKKKLNPAIETIHKAGENIKRGAIYIYEKIKTIFKSDPKDKDEYGD